MRSMKLLHILAQGTTLPNVTHFTYLSGWDPFGSCKLRQMFIYILPTE